MVIPGRASSRELGIRFESKAFKLFAGMKRRLDSVLAA
jgi:hypothetical protein